jgi:putative nucleotidyltransferase with HDIG domain
VLYLDRDDTKRIAQFVVDLFYPSHRLGPVPDRETCFALMARFAMPPHIIIHSLMVAEAACRLGAALVRAGHLLDLPLIEAGALLHDIAKRECLDKRCDHSLRGFEIMTSLGYPGLAKVIGEHVNVQSARSQNGLISPSVVVNYADKRVRHDRVVSLNERHQDLMNRYGDTPDKAAMVAQMAEDSRRL